MGSKSSKSSCYRMGDSPATAPDVVRRMEDSSPGKAASPSREKRKGILKRRIRHQRTGSNDESHLADHKRTRAKGLKTRELIKAGMKQDRVCAALDEKDLDAILETMDYFEFSKGDLIVQQGKTGNTFFVTHTGSIEVCVNDKVCNTLAGGSAFGGLAVLYHAPRTATVRALSDCGVWGANGDTVHAALEESSQKHYAENRRFIDSVKLFGALTHEQKDRVGDSCLTEVIKPGVRVMTEGDAPTAIYFVKKGELQVYKGGSVQKNGEFVGGNELSRLGPGDCFGERALLHNEPRTATVVARGTCELLCISIGDLKDILGNDMGAALERNLILLALKRSPRYSQFSPAQQYELVNAMEIKDYAANAAVEEGFPFAIVVDGQLMGKSKDQPVTLERGQCYEDGAIIETDEHSRSYNRKPSEAMAALDKEQALRSLIASKEARIGVLTAQGLANVMTKLGLAQNASAEEAASYTRKMVLAKKVHIFRHLSDEQINKLVNAFEVQKYTKGTVVIKQGEVASSFFVIAQGEVTVTVNGERKRTMGKNAYLGERALLFDEPRSATIEVSSNEAELLCVDKATFHNIVKGKMQRELMNRIGLQDTNITLKDCKHVKVIGTGAAGVVRLVKHKTTGMRYALKRVQKHKGRIPEEVKRECELLAENDHPFIITVVKTFETVKSVYILQELMMGGELHDAIRRIPTVLSRAQAQFYTGSLVIIIEELADRNIVYRDLKPENVMLDEQGYLKLIDFGIAKKLEEGKARTYTLVGTPHYMAPEVMRGHGYGTEVDLWSLGVMLFEFVCGYLPFADDLDDPSEVCRAVLKEPLNFPSRYRDQPGKQLMQGLLCRQPKRRLGAGINRFEDVRNADFFKVGHPESSLFNKIMGRELDPPVVPQGEVYCDSEEVQQANAGLSDDAELG